MASCLIQQLFRQKIYQELDPEIVEGVMFHLLRPQKNSPKDLLEDIRLSHNAVNRWLNIAPVLEYTANAPYPSGLMSWSDARASRNKGPLTPSRHDVFIDGRRRYPILRAQGKITSSHRRKCIIIHDWGGVDFVNEFRAPVLSGGPNLFDPSIRINYINQSLRNSFDP